MVERNSSCIVHADDSFAKTVLNAIPRPAWWIDFLTTEPLAFASLDRWSGTVAELLDEAPRQVDEYGYEPTAYHIKAGDHVHVHNLKSSRW